MEGLSKDPEAPEDGLAGAQKGESGK